MKPELTNLLHRLSSRDSGTEGFQNLTIFPNGSALATYRHGCRRFRDLSELDQFAYAQNAQNEAKAPLPTEPTQANP